MIFYRFFLSFINNKGILFYMNIFLFSIVMSIFLAKYYTKSLITSRTLITSNENFRKKFFVCIIITILLLLDNIIMLFPFNNVSITLLIEKLLSLTSHVLHLMFDGYREWNIKGILIRLLMLVCSLSELFLAVHSYFFSIKNIMYFVIFLFSWFIYKIYVKR